MVVGMFPLAKLGYLALRQVSKPIANAIKVQAKRSTFFREKVCIPPAQVYHYWETVIKMRMYGLGKPDKVKELNVEAAVELGADMLGEMVVFAVGAFALFLEYRRQATNTAQREQSQFQRIGDLEQRVALLQAQVEALERNANASTLKKLVPGFLKRAEPPTQSESQGELKQQPEPAVEGQPSNKPSDVPAGKGEKPSNASVVPSKDNVQLSSKTGSSETASPAQKEVVTQTATDLPPSSAQNRNASAPTVQQPVPIPETTPPPNVDQTSEPSLLQRSFSQISKWVGGQE